ncbi:MAG TPA: hydroxysqualene dehydroxylase HpnE [Bacteroidota bacterium]|nr:hydroxysqualene dehydroxylase HpnE [Bacteroidota bacterium]
MVIIGGGLSGLAAAVQLALNGVQVAIVEQSSKLGGRCYSYVDTKTGDSIDNGQHVLLGAYTHTLNYLKLIGTQHFLKRFKKLSLPLFHPSLGFDEFELSSLPKPFHLTVGMLKFKLLSIRQRHNLLRVGLFLRRWNTKIEKRLAGLTIEEWLNDLGQSDHAKSCLWYPIAISVMNELPERASALLFARVLRTAFMGSKADSSIMIPLIGQTELYVRTALDILRQHKGKIFFNREVKKLELSKMNIGGVRLTNGDLIPARYVISSVPHLLLNKIIPEFLHSETPFSDLHKLNSSPIISIHLWFDKEFMNLEYCGFIDSTLQWVFNKRKILNDTSKPSSYLSSVISGAYNIVNLPKQKILSLVLNDIHRAYPQSRQAKLIHSVVIKERRATFSPDCLSNSIRPNTETLINNFFLAGDWTNTGLPATIEGAVMSGFKAASLVLQKH